MKNLTKIKIITESVFEVTDISSKSRKREIADARSAFVMLCFNNTLNSLRPIMEKINRDRTLFYHSYEKAKYLFKSESKFNDLYMIAQERIKQEIVLKKSDPETNNSLAAHHYKMYNFYVNQIEVN